MKNKYVVIIIIVLFGLTYLFLEYTEFKQNEKLEKLESEKVDLISSVNNLKNVNENSFIILNDSLNRIQFFDILNIGSKKKDFKISEGKNKLKSARKFFKNYNLMWNEQSVIKDSIIKVYESSTLLSELSKKKHINFINNHQNYINDLVSIHKDIYDNYENVIELLDNSQYEIKNDTIIFINDEKKDAEKKVDIFGNEINTAENNKLLYNNYIQRHEFLVNQFELAESMYEVRNIEIDMIK